MWSKGVRKGGYAFVLMATKEGAVAAIREGVIRLASSLLVLPLLPAMGADPLNAPKSAEPDKMSNLYQVCFPAYENSVLMGADPLTAPKSAEPDKMSNLDQVCFPAYENSVLEKLRKVAFGIISIPVELKGLSCTWMYMDFSLLFLAAAKQKMMQEEAKHKNGLMESAIAGDMLQGKFPFDENQILNWQRSLRSVVICFKEISV